METAAFRVKSHQMCTQINQCQHAILTLSERESMRDGGRKRGCWRHLKLPWESCATASYLLRYWPPLSHSIACVSVCLQASQSGSVTLCCFSSWLLLSSFHQPFPSRSVFYPTFPLPFFIPLSPFSLFLSLFFLLSPVSASVELPTVALFCHLPALSRRPATSSSLLPTPLLLTGRRGGGGGGG